MSTEGDSPPKAVLDLLDKQGMPLLVSDLDDHQLITELTHLLERKLSPRICFHGNHLVIRGQGVLLLGKSGIGKSDDCLELIASGNQLVADDVVRIIRTPDDKLVGCADSLTKHHMNVRGLGIVNIRELYGTSAVIDEHSIDLVIYLEPLNAENARFRLLKEAEEIEILGLKRTMLRLPVTPGRNFQNLIEVAVKLYCQRLNGPDAEEILAERLRKKMAEEQG